MNMKFRLYKFNKGSLQYERISVSYKRIILFFITQIFLASALIFILSVFFDTPKEMRLKEENENLTHELYVTGEKIDMIYFYLQLLEQKDSVINKIFIGDVTGSLIVPAKTMDDKLHNIGLLLKYGNDRFQNIMKEISINHAKLQRYPAIRPVSGKDLLYVSSGFSMRIHPIYKIEKFHYGMDFVANVGTPVYATADGVVTMAENYMGYGNFIKLDHGYGYETTYGHLDKFNVKFGQEVVRGEIIGTVGNSGISTGPHLHYEVFYNDKPVNPINYYSLDITPDEYEMMLKVQNELNVAMD